MALPSGYTELAYIQSSDAQYIDTGYKANQNTKASVTYQTDRTSGNQTLLAADASWGASGFGMWNHAAEFGTATTSFSGTTSKRTMTLDRGELLFDGVTRTTLNGGSFTTPVNLTIGALNRNGSIVENNSAKFYLVEIYESGNLVRNFVPCKNGSGVIGMYDTVEGKFYSSATSTQFIAGPETARKRLEYIEGTGTQRINTGLVINDTDTYQYKLLANLTNDGWGGADGYLQFKGNVAPNRLAWITVIYNGNTKNETVLVDGVQVSTANWGTLGFSNVLIEIFGMGAKDSAIGPYAVQTGKVYACQITKGNTLVRDYIPYKINGEAGLWDNIEQKFYPNAGTGSFVAGPVADYQRIGFIQSTGTQYINTWFKASNKTRLVASMEVLFGTTSFLFGARDSSSSSSVTDSFSMPQISGASLRLDFGSLESNISVSPLQRLEIDVNANTATVNGVTTSVSAQTFRGAYDLALLAVNTAGSIYATKTTAKIYECQIYDNGELARDYIPALRSDGVAGLLDRKNSVFYTDAAGGSFIAGGVEYTPLEYIESSGTQYIDTGFMPNQNTRTMMRLQRLQSATTYGFGVRTTSSSGYIFYSEASAWYCMYGGTYYPLSAFPPGATTIDLDGKAKKATINGYSYTLSNVTFQNTQSMLLFAFREYDGSPTISSAMRLYGCRIYDDNGSLALDLVPALCETGLVGLVDKLTGSFYGNSGSGSFTAGPTAMYTKVEYIEASGAQYIDTEYCPSSNTRVVCSIDNFPRTSGTTLFGARTSSTASDRFAFLAAANDSSYRTDFYNGNVSFGTGVDFVGQFIVDKNKNVTTLNGASSASNITGTFACPYPLFLFAYNTAGTASSYASATVYSFQIYESGVLVRDLVPAVRQDGAIGLLDQIAGFFYRNSGAGTLDVGPVAKYAEVEYIESSGTQYVDTGFTPDNNTRMVVDFAATDVSIVNNLIGARSTTTRQAFTFSIGSSGQWRVGYNTSSPEIGVTADTDRHVADMDGNVLSLDGNAIYTAAVATFDGYASIYIGAIHASGTAGYMGYARYYSCQIYDNGTLVRDFVPAVRFDGVAGLYDRLNDVFYTNSGTGTFVVGPDLDYTKLEYIEGAGTQYIDTGVSGELPLSVSLKMRSGSGMSSTDTVMCGMYQGSSGCMPVYMYQGKWVVSVGSVTDISPAGYLSDNTDYVVDVNMTTDAYEMKVNGTNLLSGSISGGGNTNTLYLFARHDGNGVATRIARGRIYYFKIYRGATLVRDYISALRDNGQIGLIDLVSGLFYANAGSGVFIAGPEIVDPDPPGPPEPPGPYEPPSYIDQTLAYLQALRNPFVKLCRLRFLQPDGSTAFSLDNNPKNRRSGAFIADGSISANLQNGQRRSATVTLSNLDGAFDYNVNTIWFGTEIAIDEGLILPDGEEYYIQQGVFSIENPMESLEPTNRTAIYNLVDKWAKLDGTLFGNLESTYEVRVGTNIFEPIKATLALDKGNGEPVDRVTPIFTEYYNGKTQLLPDGTTAALTAAPYTLRIDSENGTFGDVFLGLAGMVNAWIGYDPTGALRIDPSQDDILDTNKPVLWQFSLEGVSFLGATYTVRNTDVYNDYIVLGELLDDYSQPAGRATNMDPRSDTNVQTIGRKTFRISAPGFATDQQCQDLAAWKLKRSSSLQKAISISCSQIFHIEENGLVTIVRTDKPGSPVERHLVMGFTRPLTSNGEMQINAVSVQDFVTATVTSWPEMS